MRDRLKPREPGEITSISDNAQGERKPRPGIILSKTSSREGEIIAEL